MFSQRLKNLRMDRKLTQAHMADLLGISRQGYAKYENNTSQPDFDTLVKLADYFDVTTDYLLGKSNDPRLTADQEKEAFEEFYEIKELLAPLSEEDKRKVLQRLVDFTKGAVGFYKNHGYPE